MVVVVAQSLLSRSSQQAQLPIMEMVVSALLKSKILCRILLCFASFFSTVGPQNRSPRGSHRRMLPNDQQQQQQGIRSGILLIPTFPTRLENWLSIIGHALWKFLFRYIASGAQYSIERAIPPTKLSKPRHATSDCALMPLILGTEDIVCVWAPALSLVYPGERWSQNSANSWLSMVDITLVNWTCWCFSC